MALRFKFNGRALEAFAVELRRASWGVAAGIVVMGFTSRGLAVFAGCSGWLGLQAFAVMLQSLVEEECNER